MYKMLVLLAFFAFLNPAAQALNIHDTEIPTTDHQTLNGKIVSAKLAEISNIPLGPNSLRNLPAGTILSFNQKSSYANSLKLGGVIVQKKVPNQEWTLSNKTKLKLNCGKQGISAAFVLFGENFELLSGCRVSGAQNITLPGNDSLLVANKSPVEFFKDGSLKAARAASGNLSLSNDQPLSIADESSIRLYENKNIHYLSPKPGSVFYLRTELSDKTEFHQPEDMENFPVLFHKNGNLSTALLSGTAEYNVSIKAFGTDLQINASEGPIGFDPSGKVDRLVSKDSLNISVEETTYIRSIEISTRIVSYGKFKIGMKVKLVTGSQLFLTVNENERILTSYPEAGLNKLSYFNELSLKPFN